jgi:hypothetical protein
MVRTTSRLPARPTATTSPAPQSENHTRPSCHLADSPKEIPVSRVVGWDTWALVVVTVASCVSVALFTRYVAAACAASTCPRVKPPDWRLGR